jgi:hypothetical protein
MRAPRRARLDGKEGKGNATSEVLFFNSLGATIGRFSR